MDIDLGSGSLVRNRRFDDLRGPILALIFDALQNRWDFWGFANSIFLIELWDSDLKGITSLWIILFFRNTITELLIDFLVFNEFFICDLKVIGCVMHRLVGFALFWRNILTVSSGHLFDSL